MIRNGSFREDLYCRLAVLTVEACPLRDRREDIPAIVSRFLCEAANATNGSVTQRAAYFIEQNALELLCQFDYAGNIRSLRNLIFELTSYVEINEPISIELVQVSLASLCSRRAHSVTDQSGALPQFDVATTSVGGVRSFDLQGHDYIRSIAREGDIILPLELCVLRRSETFKEWTARAKRYSIEAARKATGGSMRSAAVRLGLTRNSLLGHLHRARQVQNQSQFDWEDQYH